jgi:hypothetical protein
VTRVDEPLLDHLPGDVGFDVRAMVAANRSHGDFAAELGWPSAGAKGMLQTAFDSGGKEHWRDVRRHAESELKQLRLNSMFQKPQAIGFPLLCQFVE